MKMDNVLATLSDDCFMMRPNGFLKQTDFTSDLLEINPINDKMELRDGVIVNIFVAERINSSYTSAALWMIRGSLESFMIFERHSISLLSPISISQHLKLFIYTVDLPSLKFGFQCLRPTIPTAITGPSPCAHVASVMVMSDLKIDIQP
ncbi:hypothetical protein BD560DRAFT_427700 [Blakeslea trispora]|nr:hypothetical protein BD560DRAFT_427700 [Blakeslea trispora]